ncbi:MAG: winged helix-turn-helix domain-containing protein, partial [Acidobacteria bacterium]|nr:winged helix-turn-helix domain-containing protein [Acidobacteriota bacterium]
MMTPSPVRFGVFELDLHTGELRKHGIRVKLQDQPFHVLRLLVERPGELVTREEIQRAVWGENTFVDFDQSLNRAINKVREALGDTADHPRYIETMARRGYRFV